MKGQIDHRDVSIKMNASFKLLEEIKDSIEDIKGNFKLFNEQGYL